MSRQPTYTDEQLRLAVEQARSWRDVLRRLGLKATSASAIRSVRSRADALGLSHDHFTGQRRWTESQLREAVASSQTWDEVASRLALHGNTARIVAKGHAHRLGLELTHLSAPPVDGPCAEVTGLEPSPVHLRRAGPMLAAAWFTMCGADVAWPLEPCVYDLLVACGERTRRVQVKTTTQRSGSSWTVSLSHHARESCPYDPDELDWFFVVDGTLSCYLIPSGVVAGRFVISLSAYERYRLDGFVAGDSAAGSGGLT